MLKPFKNINETFTLEEFEEIKTVKEKTGLDWHEFIIYAAKNLNTNQN